jgi:hypothetical protein
MITRRDELRKIDFSDVATGKRLASVHPGEVLLKDFIEPMANRALSEESIKGQDVIREPLV